MRFVRSPVAWCLLLAVAVRSALFIPDATADTGRFFHQALMLLSGEGFGTWTRLPPGYPAFLALLSLISGTRVDAWQLTAWICHILMSVATCYLIYAAVRPRAPRLAVGAFVLMAVAPVHARLTGYLLSETLSTFLASILAYQVSRYEIRGIGPGRAMFLGCLCVALLLTAPATIFLAFFVWCYVAWGNRKKPRNLAALTIGSLLLMVPWQAHCYRVTGRIQPRVYTFDLVTTDSAWKLWCRTWMATQGDMDVWWHPEKFCDIPDSVFSSEQQRAELTALHHQFFDKDLYWLRDPEFEAAFGTAAAERVAESPWRHHVVLPTKRMISLWFDVEYGWKKAIQQLDRFPFTRSISAGRSMTHVAIRSLVGITGVLLYNGVHLVVLVVALCGLRKWSVMPWLVVSSVVIYSTISALGGMGEYRRDLPFLPFLLLILFYLGSDKTVTTKRE